MTSGSSIGLGIIGVGTIGKLQIDLLSKPDAPDLRIVAAVSLCANPLNSNIVLFQEYGDLLMRDDIDAVTINTPPASHYQIAVDALNAGKDVLVEKPPALNIRECREMIDFAEERQQVLFMAFHARYHSSVEAMRQQLGEEEITCLEITYRENVMNYHNQSEWIFDPKIAGGGVLMDSGINAISVVTSIFGDNFNYKVERAALSYSIEQPVETAADVEFTIGSRGRGRLKMNWLHDGPEHRMIEAATAGGHYYSLNLISDELQKDGVVVKSGSKNQQDRVDQYSEYKSLYKDFVHHIKNRCSLTSKTEIAFIQKAYGIAKYSAR
ncbi:MAG: Gfo/Idh/MocA family protein [Candidatus Dormibacteraceae bacterium]